MICRNIEEILTESDVEQKFAYPLLTADPPFGLGLPSTQIRTKPDIRSLPIGKGASGKLYYPDGVALFEGLPLLILEAKEPHGDLNEAGREARLYAAELNSKYRAGLNPCRYCIVTTAAETRLYAWDSDRPKATFLIEQADPTDREFSQFLALVGYEALLREAGDLAHSLRPPKLFRPLNLLGGKTAREEEIGMNTFGRSLSSQYRNIFNPSTREDRIQVVKNAYIASKQRERYLEEIDRLIRASCPPCINDAQLVENTEVPREVTARFTDLQKLRNQVLLLIGTVGAGKSTFVDYLREVAIPAEVKQNTVWAHIDLNTAPITAEKIYDWLTEQLIEIIPASDPDNDIESLAGLKSLYHWDCKQFYRGEGSLFSEDSIEFKTRFADLLTSLKRDRNKTLKRIEERFCSQRAKLLIVVLDNCDKRDRDAQLLMFEVAKWLQENVRCLVILPLRNVTYDHYRNHPPLDTALKDLIFRIEPPNFQKVLTARIKMVMKAMTTDPDTKTLSYVLGDNIVIHYPASDLGRFLASIVSSLFEHQRFVRRMITGLAGWDIRRAMEIFLDFCRSGFIDEAVILKHQATNTPYILKREVVSRILLRGNRRFYEGDSSYVKNLFQCDPTDPRPDHFVRYRILEWLRLRSREPGPNGIKGYHRVADLISDLVVLGASRKRVLAEIEYLIRAMCILPEDQRMDKVTDEDLIAITPAGHVHLQLVQEFNYLAACAEDCWMGDENAAKLVRGAIGDRDLRRALGLPSTLTCAAALVSTLQTDVSEMVPPTRHVTTAPNGDELLPDLALLWNQLESAKQKVICTKQRPY